MTRPSATATRSAAASAPGESVDLLASGPVRPLVRRARGLILSSAQLKRRAEAPIPVALTGRRSGRSARAGLVSLIDRFPAVRNQGRRGTCVAFASMAYLEYHLTIGSAKNPRRSEQFFYWACKEVDGTNAEGTTLASARKVLKTHGVCLHATWKYNPDYGATEGQGPPPDKAVAEAEAMKWSKATDQSGGDVEALCTQLDQGRPVVLGVRTFPTWDFPTVADTGEINLPLPLDVPDGGHAVCLIGYERRPNAPGGGVFVFRNSWGKTWAARSRYKPGYGTLFFEYVRLYAVEAFV